MSLGRGSLQSQIKYVEDNIAIKKRIGKDASYEEGLVKEWRRYLPGGDKRHLWLAYSHEGSHHKMPALASESQF